MWQRRKSTGYHNIRGCRKANLRQEFVELLCLRIWEKGMGGEQIWELCPSDKHFFQSVLNCLCIFVTQSVLGITLCLFSTKNEVSQGGRGQCQLLEFYGHCLNQKCGFQEPLLLPSSIAFTHELFKLFYSYGPWQKKSSIHKVHISRSSFFVTV